MNEKDTTIGVEEKQQVNGEHERSQESIDESPIQKVLIGEDVPLIEEKEIDVEKGQKLNVEHERSQEAVDEYPVEKVLIGEEVTLTDPFDIYGKYFFAQNFL